jgi:hypothetical protein
MAEQRLPLQTRAAIALVRTTTTVLKATGNPTQTRVSSLNCSALG